MYYTMLTGCCMNYSHMNVKHCHAGHIDSRPRGKHPPLSVKMVQPTRSHKKRCYFTPQDLSFM